MEWTQIKSGAWLGFEGDELHCIVEKIEDLPVEGWCPNILQDTFTTPEAAMKRGEVILKRIADHNAMHDRPPSPSYAQIVLPILKTVVQALELTSPDSEAKK
jgi:hypothetical protein